MPKINNVFRTLGARCDLKVITEKLSPKQKEWLKIIIEYKKSCGCFYK